jgi:hypothetical protein
VAYCAAHRSDARDVSGDFGQADFHFYAAKTFVYRSAARCQRVAPALG